MPCSCNGSNNDEDSSDALQLQQGGHDDDSNGDDNALQLQQGNDNDDNDDEALQLKADHECGSPTSRSAFTSGNTHGKPDPWVRVPSLTDHLWVQVKLLHLRVPL